MSAVMLGLCVLSACGDDGTGPDPVVTLDLAPDSLLMTLGEGTRSAIAVTQTGTTARPAFSSSNPDVATVDSEGVVTAMGVGTTFIVATLMTVRDSTRVTVVAPKQPPPGQIALLGTGRVPERFTAEVTARGDWAYTTTWSSRSGVRGNALKIWNVAGNTPVLTDSIIVAGAGTLSDVQISDDGSLLAVSIEGGSTVNGFVIYDRSNPARPTQLAHYTAANTRSGVHTLKLGRVNGRHYAFLQVDPPSPLIVIVDITNPAAPVEVSARPVGRPFVHDVFVRDGILLAAGWDDGMVIFDIGGAGRGGSPSNPVQLGGVKTASCPGCGAGTSSVHNIWWFHDPVTGSKKYAFIGEEGPASLFTFARGDIHVVDVSDFSNPREVAFFRPDSATTSTGFQGTGVHNFDMDEASGILYAGYYNSGVRALDVRGDLGTCTAAEKSADGRCNLRLMGREVGVGLTSFPTFIWGVKVVGNFLYASDMPNGLHKLNIAPLRR